MKQPSEVAKAGDIDVDMAERALMNHRNWCGVPDGIACEGCRQTCIEGVEALRATNRLHSPEDVTSFVQLREVNNVWHFDLDPGHPDVRLVFDALTSEQCRGSAMEAAQVIVAAMIRTGMLEPAV